MTASARKFLAVFCLGIAAVSFAYVPEGISGKSPATTVPATEAGNEETTDIQWFRDQLEISEQYLGEREGIFGMSWGHFFTMVFLVVVAVGAFVLFVQRQRRAREILELIRKEMENGNSG